MVWKSYMHEEVKSIWEEINEGKVKCFTVFILNWSNSYLFKAIIITVYLVFIENE